MSLTYEKAKVRLEKVKTEKQLLQIIEKLDIHASGSVTVLYSGIAAVEYYDSGKKISAGSIAQSILDNGDDVRIIDNTEAAKFLDVNRNTALLDALERIFGDNPFTHGSKSNRFLYGGLDEQNRVVKGAWDVVSARFVDATEGAVVTITGGADQNRVFGRTEIPHILDNQKITTVDGIPQQQLVQLTADEAFRAVRAVSEVRVSEIRIAVDEAGRPIEIDGTYRLDTRKFFADTPGIEGTELAENTPTRAMAEFVPPDRVASHVEGVKDLQRVETNLAQTIAETADANTTPVDPAASPTAGLLRSLEHVGTAIDVLTLAMASLEAKAAYDQGDTEKARDILMDWVLENGGAVAAGRLAAMATAPLLAAGPLGVLLAAGITVGASVVGGLYGDDLARQIFKELFQWTDEILDSLKELFFTAEFTVSPIILDLDGNGASSLRQTTSGIYFDHDGNGFAERTGWVAPGDVLLVHDLDRNGRIETGAELFGNQTLLPAGTKAWGGFEALGQFDSNLDGRITALDPVWSELQAWRDGNSNAKVDAGELLSLQAVGVAALKLAFTYGFQDDEQGNIHKQLGKYQSTDGSEYAMDDVWFTVDLARTQQRDLQPVPQSLRLLPDLPGIGNVGSLHQEMASDAAGPLPGLIREWVMADSARRNQLMESIILHWTGVQDFSVTDPYQDLEGMRKLAALETLVGRKFRDGWPVQKPGFRSLAVVETAFGNLSALMEDQLIAQVDVLPLLRAASASTIAGDGIETLDYGAVVEMLRRQLVGNQDMMRLVKIGNVLDRLDADGKELLQAMAERSKSENGLFGLQLQALVESDTCSFGGELDDLISGGAVNEWIEGRQGNDTLAGNGGDDILIGGAGNDSIFGGYGNDVYAFASGDGADLLDDTDFTPGNVDEVRFTDVTSADVRGLQRVGNNLLMQYGSSDQLTLQNYFVGDAYRIEQFRFEDGVVWGQAELGQRLLPGAALA